MLSVTVLLAVLLAFALTAAVTPIIRGWSVRRGWVDNPDGVRKLHERPIATVGGLAVAAGVAVALGSVALVELLSVDPVGLPSAMFWVGAALIVLTGFVDDTRGVDFKTKFLVQILVAYLLLLSGVRLDLSALPLLNGDAFLAALFAIPLTMLWIVGVINAVNLLDGLDGLASGVCLIAFTALGIVFLLAGQAGLAIVSLAVAGALAGFLIYNFNPASIFLGDSGSLLLGYLLAVLSLQGWGNVEPGMLWLVPVVLLGLPLLDTALSIVRRLLARQAIFAPDRDHIHHRLAERLPHRRAVLVLYVAAFGFAAAAISMSLLPPIHAGSVLLAVGVLSMAGIRQLGYHESVRSRRSEGEVAQLPLPELGSGDGAAAPASEPKPVVPRERIHSPISRPDTEAPIPERTRRPTMPTKAVWE